MNEIIAGSIFILSPTDALYCTCILGNKLCNRIGCFDQGVAFTCSSNVNTSNSKPNTSRKSKSIPFSLHDSQRGLGFYLYLDFLYPPIATTMYKTFWETGHVKTIKKYLIFYLHVVQSPFLPIEWPSKMLTGQVCHLHTCLADDLERKPNMDPWN